MGGGGGDGVGCWLNGYLEISLQNIHSPARAGYSRVDGLAAAKPDPLVNVLTISTLFFVYLFQIIHAYYYLRFAAGVGLSKSRLRKEEEVVVV